MKQLSELKLNLQEIEPPMSDVRIEKINSNRVIMTEPDPIISESHNEEYH